MSASAPTRVLVVAHRTAATPGLLEEVHRRAREGCSLDLLVPDVSGKEDAESTLSLALPLLEEAAGRPVRGLTCGPDPYESVKDTLASGEYDEVIVSTLPEQRSEWLRRNLPRQILKLGYPVTVVTASAHAGEPVARGAAQ
jgi:hypothetical protein